MTSDCLVLHSSSSLEETVVCFLKQGLQRAPVVDKWGKPIGLVEINSFLIAMVGGIDLSSPVHEVMAREFLTIDENAPLEKLISYPISTILVISQEGLLTGVITKSDMHRIIGEKYGLYNKQLSNIIDTLPDGLLVI
ncbi:MAG: CBS domain-containing protein, partial [Bacillota bacterium]|nr:CBS domain-containing protein [Bacillota bacterium]